MRKTFVALSIGLAFSLGLSACGEQSSAPQSQDVPVAPPVAESTTPKVEVKAQTESEKLNEWFEVKYEEELMDSPIQLTFLGRKERYGELDDLSEAASIKRHAWKKQSVAEMKSNFDYEQLDESAKLSYDLWIYQFEQMDAAMDFMRHEYIFDQMSGTHSFLPTLMMQFHKVEEESDMQAYASRLSAIGRGMSQLIERAKANAENNVRPPRFAYEIVTKEAKDIISGKPFDNSDKESTLLKDAKSKLDALVKAEKIDQARSDELLVEVSNALTKSFGPSYQSLIAYLEEEIKNTSAKPQGVHALPSGKAYYATLLNSNTTTNMSADQVHELGLKEVKRLRAEMEEIKEKDNFKGTLQEYFSYIRDSKDDPKFYFENNDAGRQGYIDEATAAIDTIKSELPNYFGILPKADLVVKRVESFREQDGAPQHYFPGTPDGARPGIYYAHLSDMKAMPKNELEVIAYHEGLPGHHMQISIAQELKGIPQFRTQARFTAYIEGWALYSEVLAKEIPGTFTTLNSDFGRLGSEIWRAIRLVVDTGMHHKGWSMEQAINYFSENSPAPLETIKAEIQRYLVIPGQATSYKVGMIDIQRLRKMAETQLGDQFDIRAFHDTVLDGGALPLSLLERKVKTWIASVKAS